MTLVLGVAMEQSRRNIQNNLPKLLKPPTKPTKTIATNLLIMIGPHHFSHSQLHINSNRTFTIQLGSNPSLAKILIPSYYSFEMINKTAIISFFAFEHGTIGHPNQTEEEIEQNGTPIPVTIMIENCQESVEIELEERSKQSLQGEEKQLGDKWWRRMVSILLAE